MRKPKGFTLIELLVVISVIVLLMAILLPVVQRVRNQARAVVCQANLKQWGTILGLYVEENQGRLPRHGNGWIWLLRGSAPNEDDPNGPEILNPVYTKGIAFCPMAIRSGREVPRTFRAWEFTLNGAPVRGSYGFNGCLTWRLLGRGFRHDPRGPDVFSLRGKGSIPALLDSQGPLGSPCANDRPPPSDRSGGNNMLCFSINRHDRCINSLFLDWSVRRIGIKQLWTLKWHPDFDKAGPWTKAGGVWPEDWPRWMRNFKDY